MARNIIRDSMMTSLKALFAVSAALFLVACEAEKPHGDAMSDDAMMGDTMSDHSMSGDTMMHSDGMASN